MRLVPNQDFQHIATLFERHFRALAPESVTVQVRFLHGGMPYVCPTDLPGYRAAAEAMRQTFGRDPLPFYSGGSIPIISTFEKVLGLRSILMGFGLGEDAIHSPTKVLLYRISTVGSKPSSDSTAYTPRRCNPYKHDPHFMDSGSVGRTQPPAERSKLPATG